MRATRYLRACLVLFLVALAWNGLVHLVLLPGVDAAASHAFRPDLQGKLWLSLVSSAGMICLFVWGYSRFARGSKVGEGLLWGLFFALTAGLLVDLNQYVLYPIPVWVAATWFASGLAEFLLYGALVTRLVPPTIAREP